ncbi:MAG TPA: hypothetical protein VFH85_08860 [Gammaproteobacteria bacterium]|nr:hypothetical protein [Gammaproteobacteria bacterium]
MDKVASSKAFGFGIFAIAAWLVSMSMSGLAHIGFNAPMGTVADLAFLGLLIAAIAAFLRHETWLAFFFMLWSAAYFAGGGMAAAGWGWLALSLVNFYLAFAASKCEQEPAVTLAVFLIAISALGAGLSGVLGTMLAAHIGGYFGLAAALVAFYISAAYITHPSGCETMPCMHRKTRQTATLM